MGFRGAAARLALLRDRRFGRCVFGLADHLIGPFFGYIAFARSVTGVIRQCLAGSFPPDRLSLGRVRHSGTCGEANLLPSPAGRPGRPFPQDCCRACPVPAARHPHPGRYPGPHSHAWAGYPNDRRRYPIACGYAPDEGADQEKRQAAGQQDANGRGQDEQRILAFGKNAVVLETGMGLYVTTGATVGCACCVGAGVGG